MISITSLLNRCMSKYFSISELCASQTATRRGIDNSPDRAAYSALNDLIVNILHPLREHFGRPVIISSGYRSPALNRAVKGSRSSQHCFGQAADLTVHGVSDFEVAKWIENNLPFDQLILEFPPHGWVHVSYGPRQRRQTLTATRSRFGRTVYTPGLNP